MNQSKQLSDLHTDKLDKESSRLSGFGFDDINGVYAIIDGSVHPLPYDLTNALLQEYFNAKQNSNTAINTTNIASQGVDNAKYIKTIDNSHKVSIKGIGATSIKNPQVQVDNTVLGFIPITPSNMRIMEIKMGNNPNTSKRALIIRWYADGNEILSYIDVTYE